MTNPAPPKNSSGLFVPDKIVVDEQAAALPLTGQVLRRCSGVPVEYVPDASELIRRYRQDMPAGFDGKRQLLLCKNRGRFLEACPGTKRDYRCCQYLILNTGLGCPLDCTYCVLQAYLNNPFLTLFVNRDDMLAELERSVRLARGRFLRIGTGEFMDSLALEHLTDFIPAIADFFRRRPHLTLELKTKTTHIAHLLEHDYSSSLIVSWSLNAPAVTAAEEAGAAPIAERIIAARTLIERGYRVGFHFDPLIRHTGWEDGYRATAALLQEHIPADRVVWISIGSLRYMPRLKTVAHARHPATKIFTGEFVPGLDGKMRYLQEIRLEMYELLVGLLRAYSKTVCLYFCMESPAVWNKTLGAAPASNWALKEELDRCICSDHGQSRQQ